MPLPTIKINRKTVDPRGLKEYPNNYNKHPDKQVGELTRSLDKFGQYKEVVIWNGYVIAGWGLTLASIQAGMTEIEVNDRSDLTREQAEALLVADNQLPRLAEPDNEMLAAILQGLDEPTKEIPGVDEQWLQEVLNQVGIFGDDGSGPPSLDELEDQFGEPGERDFWPFIKVQVSPDTKKRWDELMGMVPGDDEAGKVETLLGGIDDSLLFRG